jgi:DNA invertase Pin-like site-specific DNA recombinase
MKVIALYLRTSTNKQRKGLQAQEMALRHYCDSKNFTQLRIYSDEGISGSKSSRPALDQLMRDVYNFEIETVIVYSFSRFARSTKHLIDALEIFKEKKVNFVSITEQIDTASAIGNAFFTIIGAISQLERELISERVKNGLKNARNKGKTLGRRKSCNRNLVLELINQGMTYRKISQLADCSLSSISRIVNSSKNI